VSTGGPDLFVICKSCGSEVSPYITECPYCGNRLRKRAPKIDKDGRVSERRRRRTPSSVLPRLRRGEIPGIRAETRPYGTIAIVAVGLIGCLLWRTGAIGAHQIDVFGKPGSQWWRVFSAPFVYEDTAYPFVALVTIMMFGWLLERRHGFVPVLAIVLLGGVGGIAVGAAVYPEPQLWGASGAAIALIVAWAIPDLLALRAGEEVEGDMIGVATIAAVVALLPVAVDGASWVADGVGVLAGLLVGFPLVRWQRS